MVSFRSRKTLALILLKVLIAQGVIYGPSLEYLTNRRGQAGEFLEQRIIKLEDYAPTYSVVVPLAVNTTTAEPRTVRPTGDFTVEAPENMRIMAVIQSLHLRTKSVTSAFPPVCRDYIVFSDDSINKICGDLSTTDKKTYRIGGVMGNRTYLSTTNILNVSIYTDASTFVEEWMKSPNIVEISFTAYQSCWPSGSKGQLFNCMDQLVPYQQSCISSDLVCDGVVNCGIQSDGVFSLDEMNCNSSESGEIVTTTPLSSSGSSATNDPVSPSTTVSNPSVHTHTVLNPSIHYTIRRGGTISPLLLGNQAIIRAHNRDGSLGSEFAISPDVSISFDDRHLWINNKPFRERSPSVVQNEHNEFWPFEKINTSSEPTNLHGAIVFTIVGLMVIVVVFQILYHVVRSIHRSIQRVRADPLTVARNSSVVSEQSGLPVLRQVIDSEARITIPEETTRQMTCQIPMNKLDDAPPAYDSLFPSRASGASAPGP